MSFSIGWKNDTSADHSLYRQAGVVLALTMLGLPQRKGRWPILNEQQDAALWKHWHAQVKTGRIDLKNDSELLALSIDLAEAQALPLSVIWSAVRGWIEQGST